MIIAEISEFHKLLNFNGVTQELLKTALKETMRMNDIKFNVKWIHKDKLEADCTAHVASEGWNPETVLVLYVNRQDESSPIVQADDILQGLTKLNTTQCVCWFMSNMTLERFAETMNKITQLKAFL